MAADDEAWERRRLELEAEFGEPITVDGVTAAWRIFQRKRGHRHSTDDVLTGWYALEHSRAKRCDAKVGEADSSLEHSRAKRCDAKVGEADSSLQHQRPDVTRTLDLGTGIGTVGLLVLSGLPDGHLTCVEAQDVSFRLLQENVRQNGLEARVEMHHGDLRDLRLGRRFPLVTGSPPYFDVSAGVVPADSQKAHARFELRGTVADYARAAALHLEPDGTFVFCFPWAQKERAVRSVQAEGFTIVTQRDVIPRAGLVPLFSVFACRLGGHEARVEEPFVVRGEDGVHTAEMHALRARFGWAPQPR